MKHYIHANVLISNAARRRNLHAQIENRVNSIADKYGAYEVQLATDPVTGDEVGVVAMARFDSQASADAVIADAVAWLEANSNFVASGRVAYHECRHDEEAHEPCVDVVRWSK